MAGRFDLSAFNKNSIQKGINYLRYNGVDGILSKMRYKMRGPGLAYNGWYREIHEADEEELVAQREKAFSYNPTISILVPVYMTPEFFLRSMIESVQAQTYTNWELCIADGSRNAPLPNAEEEKSVYEKLYSLETEKIVRQYMENDPRIKYRIMEENLGISENTNTAMSMADGDYIALLDHDDILTEDALYHVVEALQEQKYDVLYTDEDKMSEDGTKYSDPALKPDFSIDLLRSYNYIQHFMVVKVENARAVGGFHREFDGAQSYDFLLRLVENTDSIKHIPRIAYHHRISSRATPASNLKKQYSKEIGKKALAAHLERLRQYATVAHTDLDGIYRVMYETPGNPFISIIVCGGNDAALMEKNLVPLFELARYSSFEVIVADAYSENPDMQRFYRNMERIRKNIKVIPANGMVSKAQLRNFGASKSTGDYLLFLDGEVELMDAAAIGDMLGICMREDVGIVSGVLYNDVGEIYRSAFVIGLNGMISCPYAGLRSRDLGYLMLNRMNIDCSAVSGSCMLVKRSLYEKLGGFSEKFKSELADADFCLRARELRFTIVCAADAGWYYHGKENDSYDRDDENLFEILWSRVLTAGDPFYNINFTRNGAPFSLTETE